MEKQKKQIFVQKFENLDLYPTGPTGGLSIRTALVPILDRERSTRMASILALPFSMEGNDDDLIGGVAQAGAWFGTR